MGLSDPDLDSDDGFGLDSLSGLSNTDHLGDEGKYCWTESSHCTSEKSYYPSEKSCEYKAKSEPCKCGGGGCSDCQCKSEIDSVDDKVVEVIIKVDELDYDVDVLKDKVCTVKAKVDLNNELLV